MAADPKTSAGARAERKAFRDYLRRQIVIANKVSPLLQVSTLERAVAWVLTRQKRYDTKAGGLGK